MGNLWEFAITLGLALIIIIGGGSLGINEYTNNARVDSTQAKISNYAFAVSQYKYEIGHYPDKLDTLKNENGQYGPWIKNDNFKDDWGNLVKYSYDEKKGFIIYSTGKKGQDASSLDAGIGKGNIGTLGK